MAENRNLAPVPGAPDYGWLRANSQAIADAWVSGPRQPWRQESAVTSGMCPISLRCSMIRSTPMP